MPVTRTLKHSPDLADVAQAHSHFEAAYGPANLLYHGQVYDPYDQQTYSFGGALAIAKLLPRSNRMHATLLDGFLPWLVSPAGHYSFDIVARGDQRARRPIVAEESLEWLADFRPYAEASKLDDVTAMLKALGFRNPVDAPTEGSITAAFRTKTRRCGVYVLHFADGAYYVGQTVDITKRFLQHRKRHTDIVRVSFRPLGRRSLGFHEAQLIRLLEMKRLRLRNIDMTSILATEPGDFDELMDTERQQRWLADPTGHDIGARRVAVTKSDAIYSERYAQFKASEWYDIVLPAVRAYMYNTLPAMLDGEASYWQTSVLPPAYTVFVRINVNAQEVFFTTLDGAEPYFYVLLSRRELVRAFGDDLVGLSARYPGIEREEVGYRAGGSDQLSVSLWGAEVALRFFTDRDVIPALRHYNLRLMKKGKCLWARYHNFELVTDLLSERPVAAPVGV